MSNIYSDAGNILLSGCGGGMVACVVGVGCDVTDEYNGGCLNSSAESRHACLFN